MRTSEVSSHIQIHILALVCRFEYIILHYWEEFCMNMLSCQMVQLSNGGLKTGQKMHILWFKMSILSHDQTI